MRKISIMVGRIIALCLAFVLGFFSAFGAIAGGIYLAYSKVSVDKINEWSEKFGLGILIPTDSFVDQEADKPITSFTLQDLLAEVQTISETQLTLNQMINRYGLILPDGMVEKMPDSVMNDIPFAALFSAEGIQTVMDTVTVTDVLDMIPGDIAATIVSDPMRDELSDNTLSDIVEMNMGYIFNGIELGYLTGVTYELDENEEYQVVFIDPDNPTLMELIAPLDLGGILTAVSNGEGDVLQVIDNSIGDVAVQSLFGTFMKEVVALSNIIGDATLGDLIVEDPNTGRYTLDMMVVMDGKKVGVLLGYTEVQSIDPETNEPILDSETQEPIYVWYDGNEEQVKGITAKVADIYVTDFMNGTFSTDTLLDGLTIADVLAYEKAENLPVYKSDDLENPITIEKEINVWYQDGAVVDKMMGSFAEKTLDWLSTSLSTLMLSDILGYYELGEDEWYTWTVETVKGEDAIVLTPAEGIMVEIADTQVGDLSSIEGTLKNMKIGEIMGHTPIYQVDDNGDYVFDEQGEKCIDHWEDKDGNKVTGVMSAFVDLTINGMSDNSKVQAKIDAITIADVMGYTQDDDGNWTKNGEPIEGVMGALAGSTVGNLANDINNIAIGEMLGHTPVYGTDAEGNEIILYWVDKNDQEVTGVMAAFCDLTINEMSEGNAVQDAIQDIKVADVIGLKKDEDTGDWYDDENGNGVYDEGEKATGVMAALADTKVGEISTKMDEITIGEMLGLTKDENDVWHNSDGSEASGVVGALADTSVGNLNSRLNKITVGEVLGYTPVYAEDSDGNPVYEKDEQGNDVRVIDHWLTTDSEGNPEMASGVTGALASTELDELNGALETLKIGEVAGYTRFEVEEIVNGEPKKVEYWCDCSKHTNDKDHVKATGILAELADLTVNQVTDNEELTDRIGNVKLADALGYKKNDNGKWCDKSGKELTGIMAKLADKPIDEMNTAIDELTLNDVIPGEKTGLLSIIPGDTKINNINTAINDSITNTPLQFFIDEKLILLDNASTLDALSLCDIVNKMVDPKGTYNYPSYIEGKVPEWRTQELTKSFDYIVTLLSDTSNAVKLSKPIEYMTYTLTASNGTTKAYFKSIEGGEMITTTDINEATTVYYEPYDVENNKYHMYYYGSNNAKTYIVFNDQISTSTEKNDSNYVFATMASVMSSDGWNILEYKDGKFVMTTSLSGIVNVKPSFK